MKTRRTTLLFSVLLIGVVVVLWWANRNPDTPSQAAAPQAEAPVIPAAPVAGTELPDVKSGTPEPVRAEVPAPLEAPEAAAPELGDQESLTTVRPFWCRFTSADDGQPVAGATVAPLLQDAGATLGSVAGASFEPATSNGEGLVELSTLEARTPAARVEAPGFGTVVFKLAEGHDTPESALEMRLSRSATLVVRMTDGASAPIVGAIVELQTRSYAITRPEGQTLFSGDVNWAGVTDHTGLCILADLPPEAGLAASAEHDGELLHKASADIVLAPGERREVHWSVGAGVQLRGWVNDQYGAPVQRREIWLTQNGLYMRPDRERHYFYSSDRNDVVQRAKTDKRGYFIMEDVTPGKWFVGPAPSDRFEGSPEPTAVAAIATAVEVSAAGLAEDLQLLAHRGLYIQGRVVGPSEEPFKFVSVSSSSELGGLRAHVDGNAFVLGPLEPVEHVLYARSPGKLAPSDRVAAMPGETDVLLELKAGGALRGYFLDARSGERCDAALVVSSEDAPFLSFGLEPKPDFSLDGLKAGTYDLTARTPDGLVGQLRALQLEAGAAREDLVLRLDQGAKLRLRYTGSSEYVQYRLLHEGAVVGANGLKSGTSELSVVPVGKILVRMSYGTRLITEREVHCGPGEEVDASFDLE